MKTKEHPEISEVEMSDILYALGDDVRLKIARRLFNAKAPLTCQQAVEEIPSLPVSTRSHCFRLLREGGVILSEPNGRECFNSVRSQEIEQKFPGLLEALLKDK